MLGNLFGKKSDDQELPPVQAPLPQQPQQPGPPGAGMAPGAPTASYPPASPLQPSETTQQPVAASSVGAPSPTEPSGADLGGSKMDPALRQNLSALSHLDTRTTQILQNAHKEAVRTKQQHIEPEQILLGLLYDEGIFQLFDQFSVDVAKISRDLQQKETPQNASGQPTLSNDSVKIFEQAYRNAKGRGVGFVEPIDVLMAIYTVNSKLAEYLKKEGVSKEQLDEKLQKSGEYTSAKKSTLERFGIDLTAEAAGGKLDPVVGRDKEVDRLVHILLRRTKNNPIIIGEAGVGKTAIIEGLAQKIISGQVPADLAKRRIIQLDVSSLVAGASHRGEFEERLREVIKDAMAASGQIILFIDEIHTLIGAGSEGGAMDASNIIKPHLARGQLQLIGTTTTAEYRKYFEKDKAFERRFQPIICEEPDEETAIKMLEVLRPKYENFHHVKISDEAIESAVKLSKKYIGERYLPDKAVDLLDEAAAEVKLAQARDRGLEAASGGKEEDEEEIESAKLGDADKEKKTDQKDKEGTPDTVQSGASTSTNPTGTPAQPSPNADHPGAAVTAPGAPASSSVSTDASGQALTGQLGGISSQPDQVGVGSALPQAPTGVSQPVPGNPVVPPVPNATGQPTSTPTPTSDQGTTQGGTPVPSANGQATQGAATQAAGTDNGVTKLEEAMIPDGSGNNGGLHDDTGKEGTVRRSDIEKVVSSWTGIPITKLTEDEGKKLLELEKRIHQRLIDQEEAVLAVSEAVRRGRIGLASGQRPIASFIFLGPSGTGKTELAKTLSEILFGRDDAIIRLDMSEYMEKHEVAKLIGAPPGYVGYEEGGQLTEAVRAKPYSIVLLDEVEKAHPDVFNILLQLLEDGRLTDNKGNTISFKNTIVICTSNIGSQLIVQKLGEKDKNVERTEEQEKKDFAELSTAVNEELRKFFRPELLNRFDDIVIFKPLRRSDMVGIAKLGIKKTAKLLKEQGYGVQITDKGLAQLAKEGYDPIYGARPLRRLIQTSIENPIALLIIGKTFAPGDVILIDYDADKNEFKFTKSEKKLEDKDKKDDKEAKGKDDGKEKDAASQSGSTTSPSGETQPVQPGASPNQPQQPGGAPQGVAMPMPNQPTINPANVPVGVESLLGNAASQAPVEKPFDPLALVSSDSVKPDAPAVGENPTPPSPVPPSSNGNGATMANGLASSGSAPN